MARGADCLICTHDLDAPTRSTNKAPALRQLLPEIPHVVARVTSVGEDEYIVAVVARSNWEGVVVGHIAVLGLTCAAAVSRSGP